MTRLVDQPAPLIADGVDAEEDALDTAVMALTGLREHAKRTLERWPALPAAAARAGAAAQALRDITEEADRALEALDAREDADGVKVRLR